MAKSQDKQGREKRKPKKDKNVIAKTNRGSEVLESVAQHREPSSKDPGAA
jgi:hypothetical protein